MGIGHRYQQVVAFAAFGLSLACSVDVVDTLVGADGGAAVGGEGGSSGEDSGGGLEEGGGGLEEGGAGEGGSAGLGGEDSSAETLFDVGSGEVEISSCELAAQFPSHIGCDFYGIDVDGPGLVDSDPFGFVVINPLAEPVEVELERVGERGWELDQAVVVEGEDDGLLTPLDNEAHGTGVHEAATFHIESSAPVILVQVTKGSRSSATTLQPTAAWSPKNPVAGWRTHVGVNERSFLAVVSRTPGTSVTITPSFGIDGAPPEWDPLWFSEQDPFGQLLDKLSLPLEPGSLLRLDALAIDAAEVDHGTSGTLVESGQEHPISVISAHSCAAIPDYLGTCGQMQEQLSPHLVGTSFVAPRLLASSVGQDEEQLVHERTMTQVVAIEPDTEVSFYYDEGGGALELDTVLIDPLEPYAVYEDQRDLLVVSDKPIIAASYMTNSLMTSFGSPSMVQLAPIAQWTAHHWVWVPDGYETHAQVVSGPATEVEISALAGIGESQPPATPAQVLDDSQIHHPQLGTVRIRRIPLAPGIHRIESSSLASVLVAGWKIQDGFAYLGGWGPSFADLGPAG